MGNKQMYRMREDAIHDEAGTAYTVYGVDVLDDAGAVSAAYPDVFWNREKATAFVAWCNENQLEPVLLHDLVEDAIQEQYMV